MLWASRAQAPGHHQYSVALRVRAVCSLAHRLLTWDLNWSPLFSSRNHTYASVGPEQVCGMRTCCPALHASLVPTSTLNPGTQLTGWSSAWAVHVFCIFASIWSWGIQTPPSSSPSDYLFTSLSPSLRPNSEAVLHTCSFCPPLNSLFYETGRKLDDTGLLRGASKEKTGSLEVSAVCVTTNTVNHEIPPSKGELRPEHHLTKTKLSIPQHS